MSSQNIIPAHFFTGDPGAVPSGVTRVLRPGMAGSSTANVGFTIDHSGYVQNLYVRATVGPGGARTDTFTVLINGAPTALTCSMVGAATTASNTANRVRFSSGDLISVQSVTAAGSTLQEVVAQFEAVGT